MAAKETTSTGHAPDTHPSALVLRQAADLFEALGQLAANNDRLCYYTHGELDGGRNNQSEHLVLELDRMRDIINRMGWLADLGSEKLRCGTGPIRGGEAERWLMNPRYVGLLDQANAEAGNV